MVDAQTVLVGGESVTPARETGFQPHEAGSLPLAVALVQGYRPGMGGHFEMLDHFAAPRNKECPGCIHRNLLFIPWGTLYATNYRTSPQT
jgi:hypothetical protein